MRRALLKMLRRLMRKDVSRRTLHSERLALQITAGDLKQLEVKSQTR